MDGVGFAPPERRYNAAVSTTNRFLLAATSLTVGAFLAYLGTRSSHMVKLPPPEPTPDAAVPADATPEPTVLPGGPVSNPASGRLTIFKLKMTEDGTSLEKQELKTAEARPEAQAIAAIAAMSGSDTSPLPRGTRALSVVFEGPLATVDLSEEFRANFAGGETMEALAINAITGTLGQFPGVTKVQVLVAGKKIDSLGGAQSLKEPLTAAAP